MKEQLRTGQAVKVVTAPQLFPTPNDLAQRMAVLAGCMAGQRILEPSAGTGSLIKAIHDSAGVDNVQVVAIEFNQSLAACLEAQKINTLGANDATYDIRCNDFLECGSELGLFDRILMNPPFENASDIKHIKHALEFLKPGGVLVAICANGPRQQEQLKPLADLWEALPEGSFKTSGTNVNTAMMIIKKPAEAPVPVNADRPPNYLKPVVFYEQQSLFSL